MSESADCTRLHPAELEKLFLHDPDANLNEKLQLLLGANTSALRQLIETSVIATSSASEDQKTQRTVFYQRVTASMPAHIAAFINEEIRRRCAHIAPILCREMQLQPIPAPKVVRTVAEQRLLIQLGVLRPLFAKLATSATIVWSPASCCLFLLAADFGKPASSPRSDAGGTEQQTIFLSPSCSSSSSSSSRRSMDVPAALQRHADTLVTGKFRDL